MIKDEDDKGHRINHCARVQRDGRGALRNPITVSGRYRISGCDDRAIGH